MKKIYKLLTLLMMLSFMISAFALPSFADEVQEKTESYEWKYDENTDVIKNCDREYARYDLPQGYKILCKDTHYIFDNSYSYGDTISSYARDGEILWFSLYDSFVYATRDGVASIEKLENGKYTGVVLYNDEATSELDDIFLSTLDADTSLEKAELDVTKLSKENEYQLRGYDETGAVSYVHGAIFEYEGNSYYINYKSLSNSYFDGDGNFSYRSGSVSAKKLDGDLLSRFSTAKKSLEYRVKYVYEEEELDSREPFIDPEKMAAIRFWVIFVAFAAVLPVILAAIGLIHLKRAIPEHKRLWLILCIGSAVWLALAIAVALVLILG